MHRADDEKVDEAVYLRYVKKKEPRNTDYGAYFEGEGSAVLPATSR